ncbi:chalcone isomerase family protein [Shewanella avicenniae]|uniref:Chalcone isomerase family protein n=1 Tax=Shewanella avicenniae TaxID=2814294 RepID=A0ABX7QPY7_9GAMM|nr:chalcone isomerase family protein [Shewanella avicenniae]QSX32751.1 chalcone isomerase family protein [Shewanella avicenniae]
MKKLVVFAVFCLSMFSFTSSARELADTQVVENLTLEGLPNLVLNGAGVRSKFFMDLYVGGLYLPGKTKSLTEVFEADYAAINLTIISGMITSEKMESAIREGFEDATHGNEAPIHDEIEQFIGLFKAEIKVGDQFLLVFAKDKGVTAYKNGEPQATVGNEQFRTALLNIWLGDKPAQKSLKKAMLSAE